MVRTAEWLLPVVQMAKAAEWRLVQILVWIVRWGPKIGWKGLSNGFAGGLEWLLVLVRAAERPLVLVKASEWLLVLVSLEAAEWLLVLVRKTQEGPVALGY